MRRYLPLLVFFALLVAISLTLAQLPAATIIEYIGAQNALYLMVVLGLIGGLTTFSGIPYHLILMSLTAGGLSPIWLGIATATGVVLGDSIMYVFSRKVAAVLPKTMMEQVTRLSSWVNHHPRLVTPGLIGYGLLSPFSNDFVVATLALSGYSYRRIIFPLYLGNIGYNIMLGYLGYYAYDWIVGLVG